MNTFYIYSALTFIITTYFFVTLYEKENQIFIFAIYLAKSKFYFTLFLNFGLMSMLFIGKIVIRLFFGEIRLSELSVSLNIFINLTASNGKNKNEIYYFPIIILDFQTNNRYFKIDYCFSLPSNVNFKLSEFQKIRLCKSLFYKKILI